jgi:hypothetical protein
VLKDPEQHELRRAHRIDANLADQPSIQNVILRHRRPIAPDEKCVRFGAAEQRPSAAGKFANDVD